jgi:hypothetical protein
MDLNYLFHRQQVERTRAEAAENEQARVAHEQLARCYETQINEVTEGDFAFPAAMPISARPKPDAQQAPQPRLDRVGQMRVDHRCADQPDAKRIDRLAALLDLEVDVRSGR